MTSSLPLVVSSMHSRSARNWTGLFRLTAVILHPSSTSVSTPVPGARGPYIPNIKDVGSCHSTASFVCKVTSRHSHCSRTVRTTPTPHVVVHCVYSCSRTHSLRSYSLRSNRLAPLTHLTPFGVPRTRIFDSIGSPLLVYSIHCPCSLRSHSCLCVVAPLL